MPAKRKYQQERTAEAPVLPSALPLDRAIAVYYRQSSMKQVGNISTDMQQIDLPKYVHTLGWGINDILLIDEDEGVSGAKRIDERKGMRRLFELIITGKIGAVAAQAEDRLFRDETQIQVNVFIDACVKQNVRVLTPFFKYNFSDKHEGPYHRLLFRMRAEQAADLLNSYVRGRLFAAKERMMRQGMWMGGNINLGYMVDNRKNLSSGIPNPNWRKFEPFEPCAKVVLRLFEIFVRFNGNIRKTLAYIYENGPYFPDFDAPEFQRLVPPGYICHKPLRILKRGGVYAPSRMALVTMMTNAIYIGHWLYKNHIVVWDNHPPIVPEDLFFLAFNRLSPYTLQGTPNPDYAPLFPRELNRRKMREEPRPIYRGLIGTYHEGQWRHATASWSPSMKAYAYSANRNDLATNQHTLWSRRCDYFDQVITEMLHAKLHATFDPEIWTSTLDSVGEDLETEHRQLDHLLHAIEQKMQTIVDNFSLVTSPTLLRALERDYTNHEQEKLRLGRKLAALEQRAEHQDELMNLARHVEYVLEHWEYMPLSDQQAVARVFIERIIVTPTGSRRVANVEIRWRDSSSDTFVLPYRADRWVLWAPREVETLKALIDEGAAQVEISAALSERNWQAIRIKAYEIIGSRTFHISPKPIRDEEKYGDYLARLERDGARANRTSGNRWRNDELEVLEQLLNKKATQLEIAAALPVRSWEAIRKKIVKLRGNSAMVGEMGQLEEGERIGDYLARNSAAAAAMEFRISGNLERQTRC